MTVATSQSSSSRRLRTVAPAVPYVAMIVGLLVFSSGWASILLYHLGVVTILTLTRSWTVPRMKRSTRCRWVLVGMVAGAALVGPTLYAMWPAVRLAGLDLAGELADLGLVDQWWILFVIYYFTVNPVLEETYWRGFLGSEARHPVWNDAVFAGYHILVLGVFVGAMWVAAAFAGLLGTAWLWRQTARACGGLLIPVVSHAAADASLILAAALLAG